MLRVPRHSVADFGPLRRHNLITFLIPCAMRPTCFPLLVFLTACTGPAPPRPAASQPQPPAKTEAPKPASAPPPAQSPLLGTTEKPAEPAPQPPVDPQAWRPQWWITAPTSAAGVVSAAAFADAASVLDARRAAVDAAHAGLASAINAEPARLTIARYTSLRLPSGSYRAFVLVTSP